MNRGKTSILRSAREGLCSCVSGVFELSLADPGKFHLGPANGNSPWTPPGEKEEGGATNFLQLVVKCLGIPDPPAGAHQKFSCLPFLPISNNNHDHDQRTQSAQLAIRNNACNNRTILSRHGSATGRSFTTTVRSQQPPPATLEPATDLAQ